jgi:hypothetical protein
MSMPFYQRAGLTAEVPIIKSNKNTVQHKPITDHRNEDTKHSKNNIGAVRKIYLTCWDKKSKP